MVTVRVVVIMAVVMMVFFDDGLRNRLSMLRRNAYIQFGKYCLCDVRVGDGCLVECVGGA